MADSDEPSTEEELIQRQKKEKKSLQAQIQQLKHSIPKGDKKRKKDASAQIAQLETELEKKHQQQIQDFRDKQQGDVTSQTQVDEVSKQLDDLTTDPEPSQEPSKRPTKAQRRRDKKAAKEIERNEEIKEQEIENLTGLRHVEHQKLKALLSKRNLCIYEIPSDGNCLYTAVEDQLERQENPIKITFESLRKQTAEHLRANKDDFMPFLTNQNGDPYSEEEFEKYCSDVASTTAWGGQLEITALSNVLKFPIEVIQADSPIILVGEEHKKSPLILSYHRHMYGLGAHYNSVIVKPEEEEDEFS